MILMAVCGLMVLAAIASIVRWGGKPIHRPWDASAQATIGQAALRYLWWIELGVIAGALGGLLVGGAGGRLAMRLLAVTAGDDAQGKLTEAEEVVGDIDFGGTLALFIFGGLLVGLLIGGIYLLLRRVLPSGWLAGIALGSLLLVVGATRVDPLRADNPDFGLVGPGWLAALVFTAVVVGEGMTVAAIVAGLSRRLPVLTSSWKTWPTALVLVLPGITIIGGMVIIAAGIVVVAVAHIPAARRVVRAPRTLALLRVALLIVVAVALPGFVEAMVHIAGT